MSTISLTYNGAEILQDVLIQSAQFESQANGTAGLCRFSVKDDGHAYSPGYFKTGGLLVLTIDGQTEWSGKVVSVGSLYPFPVEDTADPTKSARYWDIQGADWNILFSKRVMWSVADPTAKNLPTYPATQPDSEVVLDILNNYSDLSSDGIDYSGITTVGPIGVFGQDARIGNPGQTLGTAMNYVVESNGAIYYIDPDKVFQYRDVEVPTASLVLSDRPVSGEVGYRESVIYSSATDMVNDAMVWGAGMGSDQMVFSRVTDSESTGYYGTFQWTDMMSDVFIETTTERRAETEVYGSPYSHRGHREPQIEVRCVTYTPGLRVGQVVEFISNIFDESFLADVVIDDPEGTLTPDIGNFMARIAHIESNGDYTRQNSSSGAYGKYQIMPGNWRVWACDILGYPRTEGIAAKFIDPDSWFPEPTPDNQEAVANYKFSHLYNWLGDWRRVAACWRSGGSVAVRQPSEWSRGTLLYVNHACVPLGFPETTSATVLPPIGDSDPTVQTNADTQAGVGFIDNRTATYIAPIRRSVITFPTPTDARYELTIAQLYDQAFISANPYPDDHIPTLDDHYFTELVPYPTPGSVLGPGESYPAYIRKTYGYIQSYFVRYGSGGSQAGFNAAGNGVYSTAGVQNGFVASIPWYWTVCGLGYGGFGGVESAECWFLFSYIPPGAYELTWAPGAQVSGDASSMDISVRIKPANWYPGIGDMVMEKMPGE